MPVLDAMCKKSGGELNAMMRTTCAFTMAEGSKASNVLPPKARMVANLRIISGETCESTLSRLKELVADEGITVITSYSIHYTKLYEERAASRKPLKRCNNRLK